jgi:hypothetical protein
MLKHGSFNAITPHALRKKLVAMGSSDLPIAAPLPGSKDDGAQGLAHVRPLIWNVLHIKKAKAEPEKLVLPQ